MQFSRINYLALHKVIHFLSKTLLVFASNNKGYLADYLKAFGDIRVVSHDVVEQTTPRPLDDEAQKAQYSEKKKPIPTKTR